MLPANNNIDLAELTSAIATATERLGVPDCVEVRSVLVQLDGRFVNGATSMRVGFSEMPDQAEEVRRVGELLLFRSARHASGITTSERLVELLGAWTTLPDITAKVDFQFPSSVYRERSRNQWAPGPCWVLSSIHERLNPSYGNAPRGPFYDPASQFIAESLGAAAYQWTDDPQLREMSSVANSYRVVIRDSRSQLGQISLDGRDFPSTNLHVAVQRGTASPSRMDLAVIARGFDGKRSRSVHPVNSDVISVPVSLPLESISLILLNAQTGEWLDQREDAGQGTESVLAPPRETVEPTYQRLLADIERGECDTVEFKPYIDLERGKHKSYEILKVVASFSNAGGGTLYLGISDDAEIIGIARELYKSAPKSARQSLDRLRIQYADSVRRLINEGISPIPAVHVEWVEHAGHSILRLEVARSELAPHQVVEDGAYWFRRGGSCRKGLPEEFIARRSARQSDAWSTRNF